MGEGLIIGKPPPPPKAGDVDQEASGALATVTKASGALKSGTFLLVIVGYVSLKAHLNFLGVPALESFPVDAYLKETGYIITQTAISLAYLAIPITFLATLWQFLLRNWVSLRRASEWVQRLSRRILPARTRPYALWILLLIAFVWVDIVLPPGGVLLGKLDHRIPPRDPGLFTEALLGWVLVGWLTTKLTDAPSRVLAGGPAGRTPSIVQACRGTLVLLAAALAAVFGVYSDPRDYPLVRVDRPAPAEPTVGLLMLSEADEIIVFSVKAGEGHMEVVPRKDATIAVFASRDATAIGAADLVLDAPDAAADASGTGILDAAREGGRP
jgi:hypothetical protein